MLVLTRKTHQSIRIGEDVRITIVRVSQGSVRVGIECPREVAVVREELTLKATELEVIEAGAAPEDAAA